MSGINERLYKIVKRCTYTKWGTPLYFCDYGLSNKIRQKCQTQIIHIFCGLPHKSNFHYTVSRLGWAATDVVIPHLLLCHY